MLALMLALMLELMLALMMALMLDLRLQLEVQLGWMCEEGCAMRIEGEAVKSSLETERLSGVSDRPSSWLMLELLTVTVGRLVFGCFLFAITDGRSLALIAVLPLFLSTFQRAGLKVVRLVLQLL
jgi:hypothetical protein